MKKVDPELSDLGSVAHITSLNSQKYKNTISQCQDILLESADKRLDYVIP
jgi:hypothetical protein